MATFLSILSIISFIISIITIICFFGLCFNVYLIRKQIVNFDNFSKKFNILIKLGETEKAKELLIDQLLKNKNIYDITVIDSNNVTDIDKHYLNRCFEIYKEEFKVLGINKPE